MTGATDKLLIRLREDGNLWRIAFREGQINALQQAAAYFGENQMAHEGDVKEWLNNRALELIALGDKI
jgi:hypothetical protein